MTKMFFAKLSILYLRPVVESTTGRGYYQAYQTLRTAISDTLTAGSDAAKMYIKGHQSWHFQLFEPCIRAGIIKASDLIGYRTHQVYIHNSMHVPLNPDAVLDAMEALSEMMIRLPATECLRGTFGGIIRTLEKASVEEEIDDFVGFVLSLIQAPR